MTSVVARFEPRFSAIAVSLVILAGLALAVAIWAARDVLIPLAVGLLLAIMLSPVTRALERIGLSAMGAAGFVTLGLLGGLGALGYWLAPDLIAASKALPSTLATLHAKVEALRELAAPITRASDGIRDLAASGEEQPDVVVAQASPLLGALTTLGGAAMQTATAFLFLFFLLSQRRPLKSAAVRAARTNATRRRILAIVGDVKTGVARYLLTVTLINMGSGLICAGILTLLEFPSPPLWGVAVAIAGFVPYVGPLAVQAAALTVGLLAHDSMWAAAAPALALWLVSFVEGHLVTPVLVGKSMALNPFAVFSAILVGGWVWGVVGAVVSTPALIVATCVLRHGLGRPSALASRAAHESEPLSTPRVKRPWDDPKTGAQNA